MKKLLTILLLIFFPSICFGEYKYISTTTTNVEFYVEDTSIKNKGDNILFFQLQNMKQPDKWGSLSSKLYKELDCKKNQFRILSYEYYYGSMGTDLEKKVDAKNKNWVLNSPNTLNNLVAQFVCKYKKNKLILPLNSKIESYKSFCSEIGFTPGTEKFGKCVVEAMKKG